MRRVSLCPKTGLRKGAWTPDEDKLLTKYITSYGIWNWHMMPKYAGLLRCGKSCRLRWLNYLKPNIKRGKFTSEEEEVIITIHEKLGNRWSAMAASLPGRTDNEIKNYWHTHLSKRQIENTRSSGMKRELMVCDTPKNSAPQDIEIPAGIPISHEKSYDSSSSSSCSVVSMDSRISASETNIKNVTPASSEAVSDFHCSFLNEAFQEQDLYIPEEPSAQISSYPLSYFDSPYVFFDCYDLDTFFIN